MITGVGPTGIARAIELRSDGVGKSEAAAKVEQAPAQGSSAITTPAAELAAQGAPIDTALIEAIRAAIANARNHAGGGEAGDDRLARLSPRERQVMDLVVASKPNKIIADVLGISVKTVETHRARLSEKLGLKTRAEIVRYGLARDWLSEA